MQAQSGDPSSAIGACDYSRELSPFDPLQFGMLASRALAHIRLGEREAAAEWAVKAARRPNAHAHILAIAAMNLAITERCEEARAVVARTRVQLPSYMVDDFLRAFRFTQDGEALVRSGARTIDFDSLRRVPRALCTIANAGPRSVPSRSTAARTLPCAVVTAPPPPRTGGASRATARALAMTQPRGTRRP